MIELLATLLLLPAAAHAAPAFDLDSLTPAAVRAAAPDVPEVLPPVGPVRDSWELRHFNPYILKAVDHLNKNYGLLGYDIHSVLTHDVNYHTYGAVKATHPPLTMCVAAQLEIILTAYDIYSRETGDYSVYDYLPLRSYQGLAVTDLKGHIWVNSAFNAYGTADALINFGMGERVPFEKLRPGDFVNINRTTKTGHAVTFIGYINKTGAVQQAYNDSVVGFKYFSSQGRAEQGQGGFDYRYAVFSKFGCPEMPGKRDCNVIYSTDQKMLNTGSMLVPALWTHVIPQASSVQGETVLNRFYFDGVTTDD